MDKVHKTITTQYFAYATYNATKPVCSQTRKLVLKALYYTSLHHCSKFNANKFNESTELYPNPKQRSIQ
jgi:hypothetical protein